MFYIYYILLCFFCCVPSNESWTWRRLMCISRSVSHHNSVLIRIENHSWCFAHRSIFRWKRNVAFFRSVFAFFRRGPIQNYQFILFILKRKACSEGKVGGYARYCVFKLQLIFFFCERSITTQNNECAPFSVQHGNMKKYLMHFKAEQKKK